MVRYVIKIHHKAFTKGLCKIYTLQTINGLKIYLKYDTQK